MLQMTVRNNLYCHLQGFNFIILGGTRKSSQSIYSHPRQSVTITAKRLDEIQKVNAPSKSHSRDDLKTIAALKEAPALSVAGPSSKIPTKKSITDTKRPSTKKTLSMSSSAGHMPLSFSAISNPRPTREQNYTPSITNIGGAVLRYYNIRSH